MRLLHFRNPTPLLQIGGCPILQFQIVGGLMNGWIEQRDDAVFHLQRVGDINFSPLPIQKTSQAFGN